MTTYDRYCLNQTNDPNCTDGVMHGRGRLDDSQVERMGSDLDLCPGNKKPNLRLKSERAPRALC